MYSHCFSNFRLWSCEKNKVNAHQHNCFNTVMLMGKKISLLENGLFTELKMEILRHFNFFYSFHCPLRSAIQTRDNKYHYINQDWLKDILDIFWNPPPPLIKIQWTPLESTSHKLIFILVNFFSAEHARSYNIYKCQSLQISQSLLGNWKENYFSFSNKLWIILCGLKVQTQFQNLHRKGGEK